jgi:hypothetical protein
VKQAVHHQLQLRAARAEDAIESASHILKLPIESYKWIHLAAQQGLDKKHIEARDQLALLLTPPMVAEGKRRADQFMMYQGVGN